MEISMMKTSDLQIGESNEVVCRNRKPLGQENIILVKIFKSLLCFASCWFVGKISPNFEICGK